MAAKKTAKKAVKKAVAKKAKPAKKAAKRKPNAAFMAAKQPDALLAAVVGDKPLPRTEIVKKMWVYIKKSGLQNKREIKADAKLRPLFGKEVVTMFDLAKIISKHVK